MSEIVEVKTVKGERIQVIDLDTGTVLGTNLVLVYVPENEEEEILGSDSTAVEFGTNYGIPLLVDMDHEV